MGIWKQVVQAIKQEPMEMAQTAAAQITGVGTSEASQAAPQTTSQAGLTSDSANTPMSAADQQRYDQLATRRDEIELKKLRAQLHGQWAVETNLDQGMQRARMEADQKEQERKRAMEQKKEQKKMEELQVKKAEDEDLAVKAAREGSSAENKAWGAG